MANRSQGVLSQVYRALAAGTFEDALFTGDVTINGDLTVLSDMYFGNAVIDTMIVTANMKLYSGSDLTLYSDAGTTQVATWDGATGDITLKNGMYIKNSVDTVGAIYGGNATADTLNLYSNTVDAYPCILMTGAGGIDYYVTNAFDHDFYHGTELGLKVGQTIIEVYNNIYVDFEGVASDLDGMMLRCDASGHGTLAVTVGSLYLTASNAAIVLTPGTSVTSTLALTTQTTENRLFDLTFSTDSTFLAGTDITYSGGRGSSVVKLTGTHSNTTGGFHGLYSLVTASNDYAGAGDGVINIKAVTLSTDTAITDGNLYGGQFISKKAGSGVATAQAAIIGVEGWFMETGSGEVRTGIGGNFGWHTDSTLTPHAAGSVWRGVQIFCDSGGTSNAEETTALYLWGMTGSTDNGLVVGAGTWTYGIRFIAGGTVTTGIQMEGTMTTAIDIGACTTGINVAANTVIPQLITVGTLANPMHWDGVASNILVYQENTDTTPASITANKFSLSAAQSAATTSGRLECFRAEVKSYSTNAVTADMRSLVGQVEFSGDMTYTSASAADFSGAYGVIASIWSGSNVTASTGRLYPLGIFFGLETGTTLSGEDAYMYIYNFGKVCPNSVIKLYNASTPEQPIYFLDMQGAVLGSASGPVYTGDVDPNMVPDADNLGADGHIKILVGSTPYYIPIFENLA